MCIHAVASVMSDSLQPYGWYPARLLCPWDSPGKNTGVSYHALLPLVLYLNLIPIVSGTHPSDRMWSTGEGNGKPLQYSCLENPMNSMKRQNDRILKEELPRSEGAQNATGDQWRNNSRKNEGMEPKQKQYPVENVTGDRSKVRCYKEQYCIRTWNVRSMNQGKLEVVKQEMARVNVDILGIS